jgi:Icc-related predicted phosphoesterase
MKILYATDLHGHSRKYKKLIELSKGKDLLICGADILPKHGPHIKQKEFIQNFLPEFFNDIECHIIIDFGNDDLLTYYDDFKQMVDNSRNAFYSHMSEIVIEDISFIGMHYVGDYPFGLKDWCRADGSRLSDPFQYSIPVLSVKHKKYVFTRKENYHIFYSIHNLDDYLTSVRSIDQVLKELPKPFNEKVIYLFHAPPIGLKLDVCNDFRQVGCKAITNFIIDKKPLASLHGHIHESFYKTDIFYNKLNKTICIQPGQSGGHKSIVYCEFDTNDIEKTIKLTQVKC